MSTQSTTRPNLFRIQINSTAFLLCLLLEVTISDFIVVFWVVFVAFESTAFAGLKISERNYISPYEYRRKHSGDCFVYVHLFSCWTLDYCFHGIQSSGGYYRDFCPSTSRPSCFNVFLPLCAPALRDRRAFSCHRRARDHQREYRRAGKLPFVLRCSRTARWA